MEFKGEFKGIRLSSRLMEGWDFMSKLIQAGRALRLEAKFETLSDARSVNYCRPLFSLFVVPCNISTLFCILCPLVILIS